MFSPATTVEGTNHMITPGTAFLMLSLSVGGLIYYWCEKKGRLAMVEDRQEAVDETDQEGRV